MTSSAGSACRRRQLSGTLPLTVEVECGPIRNPVTGAESYPGVILPQGIILKRGDLGATTRFRVSNGIEYDHSGQYMAVGSFEYAWP